MRFLLTLATAALSLLPVHAAKEVFAHYIVGNAPELSQADWEDDIQLAQDVLIDAFVLNIASQDPNNAESLENAFAAANSKNFKLFFSFDYLAQGPWPKDQVISLIQMYGNNPAYFKHDGSKPFVSTFEGPDSAGDWPEIKATTGCFFVPDWSSLGPSGAVQRAGDTIDGLFSFDAWPTGSANITTDQDFAFKTALSGKSYMMPVSPWFYTNLPGFNKNWMWRGDELWDRRWEQVLEVQPDFVEILTWNDYGESHYIGPVRQKELGLFAAAAAPINYVENISHDGWRKLLPYYISQYKNGGANVTEEAAVVSYRSNPSTACLTGGTTGGNKLFGETEVPPEQLVDDNVFYSVLLNSSEDVTVTVSIGGQSQQGYFSSPPAGGDGSSGVYQGSVPFGFRRGNVVVTVARGGTTIAEVQGGPSISTLCINGVQNWNAAAISS
ncbi:glycoside hydrolase family 71 protein [Lasiosphaeris hirsuta]|uniref:Glycoside hydrolase family 71 protein n=1 Tax=Lasiosphaeris hirsuta TaxID=260670 RepID=A0AA40B9R9_9PEZI|nr:glycoside hydrolase family 71 protein [Lasiosphaeris hirsuta]